MINTSVKRVEYTSFQILKYIFISLTVLVGVLFFGAHAEAASLYFSPSNGKFQVGQTFSVTVAAESSDQAMNAADGVVTFPTDKLEVLSVSKGGSIYNFWVQDPSFSNSGGTANFEGIIFTPGFQGGFGQLMTITFRAKAAGNAVVSFSRGSVLANDGFGTDITKGLGSGTYSIGTAPPSTRPPTRPTVTDVPEPPTVFSFTHPDEESWYTFTDAILEWETLDGIVGVSYEFDQASTTEPDTTSEGVIDKQEYKDIAEGIWYFHVRLESRSGWGETSHFRLQIDTTNPEFFYVVPVTDEYAADSEPSFILFSFDSLSGLSHYEVEIDDTPSISFLEAGAERYTAPKLSPGVHTLKVKAVDRAGNFLEDSLEFTVGPSDSRATQLVLRLILLIFVLIGMLYILLFIILLLFFLKRCKKKRE